MKRVHIRQFTAIGEGEIISEASYLGFAPGETPELVKVYDDEAREATFTLEGLSAEGWKMKLTSYSEPTNLRGPNGPSLWCPRTMFILND